MKALRPHLFALLSIVVVSQYSCKSKNDDPAPNDGIIYADSASETGFLSVQLRRWTGVPGANIGNAYVALYLSYNDYLAFDESNGLFDLKLASGRTDGNGIVNFGYLNADNYYIYSEVETSPNVFSKRLDVVQIQRRQPVTKLVYHEF
jgi:hypothetical protein